MRDLYKRLGVRKGANVAELRNAISHANDEALKKDAICILLDSKHKSVYDQNLKIINEIGHLRNALGLAHTSNWQGALAIEFTPKNISTHSVFDDLVERIKKNKAKQQRSNTAIGCLSPFLGYIILFGGIWLISTIWSFFDGNDKGSSKSSPSKTYYSPPTPRQPPFNEPQQPLPSNGLVMNNIYDDPIAPFEIKTHYGSHYLLKLENIYTGKSLSVFVRGGNTITVNVPLGTYRVKYASGKNWYGYAHLFGPSTSYSKADQTFTFRDDGYQVRGYTITLYQVAHGNLRTSTIRPEDF